VITRSLNKGELGAYTSTLASTGVWVKHLCM